MSDEIVCSEKLGNVSSFCHIRTIFDLEDAFSDLDFACPCCFITGDLDLGPLGQLGVLILRAGKIVQEICSVLCLGVDGSLSLSIV